MLISGFLIAQIIRRSLFFVENDEKPEILQLSNNYRSHSGILNLASSIVDLIYRYFPQSIDKLQPDRGELI